MAVKILSSLAIISLAGFAQAQSPVTCTGDQLVDWESCGAIASEWEGNPDLFPSGAWTYREPSKRNCKIGYTADQQHTYSQLFTSYLRIYHNCNEPGVGGTVVEDGYGYSMFVSANDDYEPPEGSGEAQEVTAEPPAAKLMAARAPGTVSRKHARDVSARQVDGDTEAIIVAIQKGIIIEDLRKRVAGPLPSGSQYVISETDSQTTGISSSVEIGASFFEIFSASASVSVSQDYTVSNTKGVNVNVDCPAGETGIVFWQPLFDVYQGFGRPSETNFDIRIPIESSGQSYSVVCSG